MKKTLCILALLTATAAAFGQGKVTIQNDATHLILLPTDVSALNAADAALAGQPVPTTGPLPSGASLVLGLYAGTSANTMTLVTAVPAGQTQPAIVPINPAAGTGMPAGIILPTHAILPFEGGTLAYMQVRVWDSTKGSTYETAGAGYLGESAVFTMTPGLSTKLTYPGINLGGGTTCAGGVIINGWAPPPQPFVTIVSQPTNQTVRRGDGVTFSVQAVSNYPLNYQWFFNGATIPGANGVSYMISHAQPTNAGNYSVMAYTPAIPPYPVASAYSSSATLTVLVPPSIVVPPLTQTAEVGSTVVLGVSTEGDSPLTFQWFFNGSQAVGPATTNPLLNLTAVQPSQAGQYTVVVTNLWGAVTSAPAVVSVISPVPRRLVPGIALTAQPASWINVDYKAMPDTLESWTTFPTVYITNALQFFFDLSEPIPPHRIYRAWHSNMLAAPPGLNIHRVPAIILNGVVGSTLRVDYIDQFGPIDSWVPLATNVLTSTSQLYFDTSSIGQPPRLWRVVAVP